MSLTTPQYRLFRGFLGAVIALCVGGAVWYGWSWIQSAGNWSGNRAEWSPPAPPHDADQFVGGQACAACHQRIVHSFASHPMARSIQEAAASAASPTTTAFQVGPFAYRVDQDGASVQHHEILLDSRNAPITDQEVHPSFAIGSGVRGKSYVVDRGGVLFQSPISWFHDADRPLGEWRLSPGYTLERAARFERRIGAECLSCHAGRIAPAATIRSDVFAQPPLLELGISCERCHGPGKRHVELQESSDGTEIIDQQIVNPARLPPRERDAVCLQCHLSANRVLRPGRRHTDFRPGEPLEQTWLVFVRPRDARSDAADRAVSHVEQMLASRCAQASGDRLTCTSCHDPHAAPQPAEKFSAYRQACLSCHANEECTEAPERRSSAPTGDSCVDCHMPKRRPSDISHTTQTDHRIVRRPEAPQEPTDSQGRTDQIELFRGAGASLPAWELDRAWGLALFAEAQRSREDQLLIDAERRLSRADAVGPPDALVLRSLGWIHYLAGNDRRAKPLLERAVAVDDDDEKAHRLLGILGYRTGDYALGLKHLDRAIELNPYHAEVHARRGHMLAVFGDLAGATEAGERGLELEPTLTALRELIVDWYERLGDERQRDAHADLLERIVEVLPRAVDGRDP